jgi:hypothetical protein
MPLMPANGAVTDLAAPSERKGTPAEDSCRADELLGTVVG